MSGAGWFLLMRFTAAQSRASRLTPSPPDSLHHLTRVPARRAIWTQSLPPGWGVCCCTPSASSATRPTAAGIGTASFASWNLST